MDYAAARFPEPQPPPPQHHHHHHLSLPHHHPYPVPPPQAHQLTLLQTPPPPPPPPPPPLSYPSYCPYPNPNPNPNPNPSYPNPSYHSPIPAPAPGDPYAPHGGYLVGPAAGSAAAGGGMAGFYYERVAAESRGFEVKEAIPQYGFDPLGYPPVPPMPSNGLEPAAPAYAVSRQPRARPNNKGVAKKASKTTKVVQSAYCGVCKIDCTTQEVLNSHKQGKKHKKNLQKLQEAITPRPQKTQAKTKHTEKKAAPVAEGAADKGDAGSSKQRKRKESQGADLETKKQRILEGGAEPNQVMVCNICNVVVNSQTVYDSHITGSKHAAMVKKQQEAAAS